MRAGRIVVEDYHATGLSLRDHPLAFLRDDLARRGIIGCGALAQAKEGRVVEVAGLVLVRQKPGSAKGVMFITLEDESGTANAILWPDRYEAFRPVIHGAAMIAIRGRLQREGIVTHVIADRVADLTALLRRVGDRDFAYEATKGDAIRYPGAPDRGDAPWPKHAAGRCKDGGSIRVPTRDFR